jgi:hypothetical protein
MSARDARATRHYFDSTFNYQAVKVLPNEYYVTGDDVMITTVLGSCVAACIRDPQTGVGGMNHFMLPEGDSQSPASATMRYGAFAMEVLINEVLKAGASRERLQAQGLRRRRGAGRHAPDEYRRAQRPVRAELPEDGKHPGGGARPRRRLRAPHQLFSRATAAS